MFGYVRPVREMLSESDQALYRQAYCGLCHTLGRRHGWLTRFTLSYDLTLLALLAGGDEACACRCPAKPWKAPAACLCGAGMARTADVSIILTWYKLRDDIADRGLLAGLPYRLACLAFRRAHRRAAEALPELEAKTALNMARLAQFERERSPSLDRVADTFAGILAASASAFSGEGGQRRAMEQVLYHLGRWVYLADAWDDLERDRQKGRYNALDARFEGRAEQERGYVATTMTHSARLAGAAAELLELGGRRGVVENILYEGLPAAQRAVLDGRWEQVRRQRRKTHERSL